MQLRKTTTAAAAVATATAAAVPPPPNRSAAACRKSALREKPFFVMCDLCGTAAWDGATSTALRQAGWGIYERDCFCPVHEEMN